MRRFRNRYLLVIDAIILSMAVFALYGVRFESMDIGPSNLRSAVMFATLAVPLQIVVLISFGLYRRLWIFASVGELERIFGASAVAAIPTWIVGRPLLPLMDLDRVPLGVLLPYVVLSSGLVALPRFAIRVGSRRLHNRRSSDSDRRVLIAGAGAAGEMIVRELVRNSELGMIPVGFVDDDPAKHGVTLSGFPILGALADIPLVAQLRDISELIIAMPRAPGTTIREVVRAANEAGLRTRIVPGLSEILSDRVSVSSIREVRIDDLLRREPVQTDMAAVSSLATGRRVLVTGAGGSIGSELCRQISSLNPRSLILLGHGENPIFDVQNELRDSGVEHEIIPVIADVRMRHRVREVFERFRPDVVFHAAAHKHVPLMEENPSEAITNNVLGTKNVVEACGEFGVSHFVMISSDKAVRPTNVMGATKRVAEYVVHNAARHYAGNFVSVRFGNVLGSRGSVVPTFVRQIRDGRPVTVTHPEMRRYFMTIPEAVQLVLQAGAQGQGGELFMLDMGEPVKVLDLARDMIRLSGLREGVDVDIAFTGMRPGEKLYEEMFFSHEVAEPTAHPKILRARNGAMKVDDEAIDALIGLAQSGNATSNELRHRLRDLVPDYTADPAIIGGEPAIGSASRGHDSGSRMRVI